MPTAHPPVYGAEVSKLPPRRLVDVLLLVLVVVQLVELFATRRQVASVAVVVLMVVGTGALLLRARVPLPSVALAVAGFAALIQLVPASLSSTFFALLVVVGVIGSLSGPAAWLGLLGAWGIAFEGAWLDRYGGGVADFAMSAAIMAAAWVCGRLIGHGARAAAASAERVAEAERSRSEAAFLAVREERDRMTRELHDVVAHGLTVLVVQSVAAQQDLADGAPVEQVGKRLRASEEVAREALLELRTLLGILGEDEDGSPTRTGLPGVEALVQRLVRSGFPVTLRVEGDGRTWGRGVDLTLYRLVQEGLTNAVKHGDGSGARVDLRLAEEGVRVVIENDGVRADPAATGAGRGLSGLRDRVAQHQGSLEAGPTGAGYRVVCELPGLPRDETAPPTPTVPATSGTP